LKSDIGLNSPSRKPIPTGCGKICNRAIGRRQGTTEGLFQRQAKQAGRDLLLDEAKPDAAGEHDIALVRVDLAGDTTQ
jgi:hypothetical protein